MVAIVPRTETAVTAMFPRPGASGLWLGRPEEILVAWHPEEVAPVLAAAEATAQSGGWVAGFLAYEAAAGLDPALRVLPPPRGLPPAWFAVSPRSAPPPLPRAVSPPSPTRHPYAR